MQQNSSPDVRNTPPTASTDLPAAIANELGNQLAKLGVLRDRAMNLELRVADLTARRSELDEQRHSANTLERPKLDKQWFDAQHELSAKSIELRALHGNIAELESSLNSQQMTAPAPPSAPAITLQPPASPFLDGEQILEVAGGAGMLMIPIVLVLARNLWVRGTRKIQSVHSESSPQLHRIEQAIEAIAVEVERIGEAQRFTMKVLSDRPAAVPIPSPRREIGSITPH
ncbi:MAG: hypothetical protein ABI601_11550 [bacterium]